MLHCSIVEEAQAVRQRRWLADPQGSPWFTGEVGEESLSEIVAPAFRARQYGASSTT
jgi:hypothetical protein